MLKSVGPIALVVGITLLACLAFYWIAGPRPYRPHDSMTFIQEQERLATAQRPGESGRSSTANPNAPRAGVSPGTRMAQGAMTEVTDASGAEGATSGTPAQGDMVSLRIGVLDPVSQTPMAGVQVVLETETTPTLRQAMTTQPDGRSHSMRMQAGVYKVRLGIAGYELGKAGIIQIHEGAKEYWLPFHNYQSMTVTVLDANDEPMTDLTLNTEAMWEGGGGVQRQYTTDEYGRFTAENYLKGLPFAISGAEDVLLGENASAIRHRELYYGGNMVEVLQATVWAQRIVPFTICVGVVNAPLATIWNRYNFQVNGYDFTMNDAADCFVVPRQDDGEYRYVLSTRIENIHFNNEMIPRFQLQGSFTADTAEETMHVLVDLAGQYDVAFQVVTDAGEPIAGLPVYCDTLGIASDGHGYERLELTDPSDASGLIEHALPDSLESLRVGLVPNARYRIVGDFFAFDRREIGAEPLRIVVEAYPSIEGLVADAQGTPLQGMRMVAFKQDFTPIIWGQVATNEMGWFKMHLPVELLGSVEQPFILVATNELGDFEGLTVTQIQQNALAQIVARARVTDFIEGLRPEETTVSFTSRQFTSRLPQGNEALLISFRIFDVDRGGTIWSHIDSEHLELTPHVVQSQP